MRAVALLGGLIGWAVLEATLSAQVELPKTDVGEPIQFNATEAQHWQEGSQEVWILKGDCRITQGAAEATARDAVIWIDYAEPFRLVPHRVTIYLEKDVRVEVPLTDSATQRGPPPLFEGEAWLGRLFTSDRVVPPQDGSKEAPSVAPAIYHRGLKAQPENHPPTRWSQAGPIQRIQYETGAPMVPSVDVPPPGGRRIQIYPRYSTGWNTQARESDPLTGESILMVDSGVNVVVRGFDEIDTVNLLADRVVMWSKEDITSLTGAERESRLPPIEFYLEGNIVFRQGDQVVYADRMYYNVGEEYGMILEAELVTPVPDHHGLIRLKADVMQRVSRDRYLARGAAITTSRMGVPKYWFQANEIEFTDNQRPLINSLTGEAQIDPLTGEGLIRHERRATARNNLVYVEGIPLLYWPVLSADIEQPTFYIDSVRVGNDNVFGFRAGIDVNNYQLLGIQNPLPGTKWTTSFDYFSRRGPGGGMQFRYDETMFPLLNSPASGFIDAWGIYDTGRDNLGRERRDLIPEQEFRGRVWGRHRQYVFGDFRMSSELGFISDRNFLESYFEREWDTEKDFDSAIEVKRLRENRSFSVAGASRVNDFFMQTEWLPRVDHNWLGESLLWDNLTYYSHASAGYARLRPASTPTDPADLAVFDPLPYEVEAEGIRAHWRQELDLPLNVGPGKISPYILGDIGYWGQDINQNDVLRGYGQVGIRGSIMAWTVNHQVQSQLWNLNGLAHKVTLFGDVFMADSSQNLERFPLYDNIDDDAQEHFRRRLKFNTYGLPAGTPVPFRVDERSYALRYGMQSNVTSPVAEIADDLSVARLELRQAWQTKRGAPGSERIIDWITLDIGGSLFPNPDRDNFGETLGLMTYDFNWKVGNRLDLFSHGHADLFEDGLQAVTVGGYLNRTQIGNLYLSYTNVMQPFHSHLLAASLQYRMSDKWLGGFGATYDFGDAGNLGQNIFLTRIGESSLFSFSFNVDPSRDNVGVGVSFEPRFFARSRNSTINGEPLPPVGAMGLE